MSYILIIGAKSDIGKALAVQYAQQGYDLYLAARNCHELDGFDTDIEMRYGRKASAREFDLLAFDTHAEFYASLPEKPAGVICVAGVMLDQKKAEHDFVSARTMIDTNYTGCVSILNIVANDFEAAGTGFIIGISSVAGDRGRKTNYLYGSTKAAFTTYLSGLRNRLYGAGVPVLTVKPGFVNTKMTQGMSLPAKLLAQPEDVARDVFNAQQKKKDVIYTLGKWRLIMLIIRHIPEFIFKRLSL